MDLEVHVFAGGCGHCLRRIERKARSRGLGALSTIRKKRHVIEVRGASPKELEEIKALASELDIDYLEEVCGNGRKGKDRHGRKVTI